MCNKGLFSSDSYVETVVKSIIAIERNPHLQVYKISNLHAIYHYSTTRKGCEELMTRSSKLGIAFDNLRISNNYSKVDDYAQANVLNILDRSTKSLIESQMKQLFTSMSLISTIYKYNTEKKRNNKSSRLNLNFDIGNSMMECQTHDHIGPFDKTIPGLLSATFALTEEQRKLIGNIIISITSKFNTTDESHLLPSLQNFRQSFVNKLALSLFVKDKDLSKFTWEAITIGILLHVFGHNDTLNDHRKGYEDVIATHMLLDYSLFNMDEQRILKSLGCSSQIPITVIVYNRTAVGAAVDSQKLISSPRNKILKHYFDMVDQSVDIKGYHHFLVHELDNIIPRMTRKKNSNFKGEAFFEERELFNKMRWYSVFIFVYLQFLKFEHKNGIYKRHDEISIAIFAGVYMNGQSLFVQVMQNLTNNIYEGSSFIDARKKYHNSSLLVFLCRECCYLKPEHINPNGSSEPRMQFSVGLPYKTKLSDTTHSAMSSTCNYLVEHVCKTLSQLQNYTPRNEKACARDAAIVSLNVIDGMDTFKSSCMLQLCSLFGLCPLEYYNYADYGQGTEQYINFLRDKYPNEYSTDTSTRQIFKEICEAANQYYDRILSVETENSLCVLNRKYNKFDKYGKHRDSRKRDVIFKIEYGTNSVLQDFYRVWKNGNQLYQLQVFDRITKSFCAISQVNEWPHENEYFKLVFV